MHSKKVYSLILIICGILVTAKVSTATSLLVDAVDRGWYSNLGVHVASDKGTITGDMSVPMSGPPLTSFFRSFFVFDFTAIGVPFSSGTLELELAEYISNDPSEPFTIYDVTTPVTNLIADHNSVIDGGPIWTDLGEGQIYGQGAVTQADVSTIVHVPLTSAAIADINNALGGMFAVGVGLDCPFNDMLHREAASWSQGNERRVHRFALQPVPEPGTLLLFIVGLFGLAGIVKWQRHW